MRSKQNQEADSAAQGKPTPTTLAAPARQRIPRHEKTAATRAAIVDAALDEFAAKGFAGTRLDDVARRAGVAKGTIYVHFRDKESLFEELVRSSLGPIVAAAEAMPDVDMPLRQFAEHFVETFAREILGTRRRDVLRLIITEGPRFPALAHIYYRLVVQRALRLLRARVRRAVERGEVHSDALERFPQLLVAPAFIALVWQSLFAAFEPLDVATMLRTHVDLLFKAIERKDG
jgi:AcrR family transcriptional regulator